MNKVRIKILAILVFVVLLGGAFLYSIDPDRKKITIASTRSFNIDTHTAGFGSDASRVDNQITLAMPEGEVGAVYRYLRDTYSASNGLLKKAFPDLNLEGQQQEDISQFTDDYYETPDFNLYNSLDTVRHRHRSNLTDPQDKKNGRELVQIKVTPPGHFDLRTELKFKVQPPKGDTHPLLSIIDAKQRGDFENTLTDLDIDPRSLRRVFSLQQIRRRVYLNWGAENFYSFSVDTGETSVLWGKGKFSSVDLGLAETTYTASDAAKREKMKKIRDFILTDLRNHFPDLTQNSDDKYGIILNQLAKQIPKFKLLFKLGII